MGFLFPTGGGGSPGPASPNYTTSGVFGHGNSGDTVSYSIPQAIPATKISFSTGGTLDTLSSAVVAEWQRRRADTAPTLSHGLQISHNDINSLLTVIETTPYNLGVSGYYDRYGYQTNTYYSYDNGTGTGDPGPAGGPAGIAYFPQAGPQSVSGPSSFSTGGRIYASDVNNLVNAVISAGGTCMCNCNYCTCNCNYCTCNCNYACTCNCNY
jgi:hypothetical protein